MTRPLNKKRFFKWAREHEDEKVQTGTSYFTSGPLARFLNHATGRRCSTTCDHYKVPGCEPEPLPWWADLVEYHGWDLQEFKLKDLLSELRMHGVRP